MEPSFDDKENITRRLLEGTATDPPGNRPARRFMQRSQSMRIQRAVTLPPIRAPPTRFERSESSGSDFSPPARRSAGAQGRGGSSIRQALEERANLVQAGAGAVDPPASLARQRTGRYQPPTIAEAGQQSESSKSSSDSSDSEEYSPITDEVLVRKFAATLNLGWLDLSTPFRRLRSAIIALVFALLVPLLRYAIAYCPTCPDRYALKFQKLVLLLESSLSVVSYCFLYFLLSRRSLSQVLRLDTIDRDIDGLLTEYDRRVKGVFGTFGLLNLLLFPTVIIHIVTQLFYYPNADLFYLAGVCSNSRVPHCILALKSALFVITTLSWIYQTFLFLLPCSLFWLLCNLHVLKLLNFSDMLRSGDSEMAIWIMEHRGLRMALRDLSHRFRLFLISTAGIVVLGIWFSIYSLLHSKSTDLLNAGDLAVCNFVNLVGAALCLRAAAKITHRAQSIVALASQMQVALSSLELKSLAQHLNILPVSNSASSLTLARPCGGSPTKSKSKSPVLSNARSFGPGPLGLLQIDVEEDPSSSNSDSQSSSSSSDVHNADEMDLEQGPSLDRDSWAENSTRSSLGWGPDESQRPRGKGRRKGGRRVLRLKNPESTIEAAAAAAVAKAEAAAAATTGAVTLSQGNTTTTNNNNIYYDGNSNNNNKGAKDMEMVAQRLAAMESWCQRQALVAYLAHSRTGISIYGFVLDRAFVHGSLGLLTTGTLFVITRSLGA